jgi:Lon-like protease
MSRRVVTMITGAVLLVALGAAGFNLPVPYAALGPGPTLDTLGTDQNGAEIIQVTGRTERETDGQLNLTTVSVRDRLDLLTAFRGWLDGRVSVVPRETIYPPGETVEEADERQTRDFVQSQNSAETAALAELDYTKIVVTSVAEDSPSYRKLAPRDVITRLGSTRVNDFAELTGLLADISPGTTVTVGYTRSGREATTRIVTGEAQDREGAALGVGVSLESTAPFRVKIAVHESIGGPSAGLMFALGILEKVGPTDLIGDLRVAGTGTIDASGTVGPIGGVQLKMIAARDRGASVFLVPKDNCRDALQSPPDGLQVVRVETLHGAAEALTSIRSGGNAPTCDGGTG